MLATESQTPLQTFLTSPNIEDSPAWEFNNGSISQKPMPKARHSLLQKRLLAEVDAHCQDHTSLPELRCTFGNRSIVPDIAVIDWSRLPINDLGQLEDDFSAAPDWSIEILSSSQRANRVIDNLLYCLQHGCQLGWLVDPDDQSIFVLLPGQDPCVYRGEDPLPTLSSDWSINPAQIFSWLNLRSQSDPFRL